jgi:hypothetical protein
MASSDFLRRLCWNSLSYTYAWAEHSAACPGGSRPKEAESGDVGSGCDFCLQPPLRERRGVDNPARGSSEPRSHRLLFVFLCQGYTFLHPLEPPKSRETWLFHVLKFCGATCSMRNLKSSNLIPAASDSDAVVQRPARTYMSALHLPVSHCEHPHYSVQEPQALAHVHRGVLRVDELEPAHFRFIPSSALASVR